MRSSEPCRDFADVEPPKSHLELSEAFRDVDANADGRIDFVEFSCLVSVMHLRMSHAQVLDGFRKIDHDSDRAIEFGEFLAWWRGRVFN